MKWTTLYATCNACHYHNAWLHFTNPRLMKANHGRPRPTCPKRGSLKLTKTKKEHSDEGR